MVEPVDRSLYEDYEKLARERVLTRDADDWPIVAVALLLDFPIWTEDQDFFGSGVATAAVSLLGLRIESSCFYVNHERVGQETGCPPLLHPTLAGPDTSVSITTHKRG